MLLHVRERSRDIAILKAVGMSPRQLLTMIMTTSAVLGVVGGLLGTLAGVRTYHALIPSSRGRPAAASRRSRSTSSSR